MSGRLSSLAHAPAQCLACVLSHDDVDDDDVDADAGYQVALLVLRIVTEDQDQGSR